MISICQEIVFPLSWQYLCLLPAMHAHTVNQQILVAIKFGVSQDKGIWRLLNLASPRGPSMQFTIDVYICGNKYWRKHAIRQICQI